MKAARERSGGTIDAEKDLSLDRNTDDSEGSIAALFGNSMLHNRTSVDEDVTQTIWNTQSLDVTIWRMSAENCKANR